MAQLFSLMGKNYGNLCNYATLSDNLYKHQRDGAMNFLCEPHRNKGLKNTEMIIILFSANNKHYKIVSKKFMGYVY